MTVTITGTVTVGGQRFPVQVQVDLPDDIAVPSSDRSEILAAPPNHLRAVPRAS
jgi:hypothetical protein